MSIENDILASSYAAFVGEKEHKREYRPSLVTNRSGISTVLQFIEENLKSCAYFSFSVAFISLGGLTSLISSLDRAREKNIKGRILTTDYLTFTDPKALKKIKEYKNIEIKIVTDNPFHTKGYFFSKGDVNTILIGSANLTQGALKSNIELNVCFTSLENGLICKEYREEFERVWEGSEYVDDAFISSYEERYKKIEREREGEVKLPLFSVKPNEMQKEAMISLSSLREEGKDKALLIAATGTGKTYLSVFDVKNFKPNKLLYVCHRREILEKSKETFKDYLSLTDDEVGLFVGGKKEREKKYLFASIDSMRTHLLSFSPDEFDYIIIDEVHRAGALSYEKIISYFKPKFLLGMSATPDRMDKKNIYQIFDYNIAADIRLREALEKDLVVPFHYFGVEEISVNGIALDDKSDFSLLTSDERVNNILKNSKHYGYSGSRLKGLIFCRSVDEAHALSEKINERGYRSRAVDGRTPPEKREEYIERLEKDEDALSAQGECLDFLLSFDVLNEGVDIPHANQIIMLRPTLSSIVFIQQLGRGLRIASGKEFTVVIDFIGNYEKNFLIPVALSGDRSYDKDTMRGYAELGSSQIPGASTISFTEIAKERIFSSIDRANLSEAAFLNNEYLDLKNRIGRVPKLSDFEKNGAIDPLLFVSKYGSYHNFLEEKENEYMYKGKLNEDEKKSIEYISSKFENGKRSGELNFFKDSLEEGRGFAFKDKAYLYGEEGKSVKRSLDMSFILQKGNENQYKGVSFIKDETLSDEYLKMLEKEEYKSILKDVTEDGVRRNLKEYSERYKDTSFCLYRKYSYEDVCRSLCWRRNLNGGAIGGYFYDSSTHTMPIFVNYDKEEGAIGYKDRFLDRQTLFWHSKTARDSNSEDVKRIYKRGKEDEKNKLYLFVRKNKDDKTSKEFFFLGEIYATGEPKDGSIIDTKGREAKVFEVIFSLDIPVREDIYSYIIF